MVLATHFEQTFPFTFAEIYLPLTVDRGLPESSQQHAARRQAQRSLRVCDGIVTVGGLKDALRP